MDIKEIISKGRYQIVDVREPMEFQRGHVNGATNVPLSKFMDSIEELTSYEGHVLFYCRSGMRSEQATSFMKSRGCSHVRNAGSLFEMETYLRDS